MELRYYQREALNGNGRHEGVFRALAHNQRALIVLPTGTGKTIVFAHACHKWVQDGGRVLILAHRGELLDQAADKLQRAVGIDCVLEKADHSAVGALEAVTVGSVQSLMRINRLENFSRSHYSHIVVDECHHALGDSYQRVCSYFENAKVLGVTATPDRGDMRDLGTFFETLAYEYTLPQAIADGFLCPIRCQMIPLDIKLAEVGKRDWSDIEVGEALAPYIPQIADALWRTCSGRKLLVFAPLCKIAQSIRDALGKVGFRSYYASGEDRSEMSAWDRETKGACMVNAMLLTEGYDNPQIDAVCVLRPTKIRSLYSQMIGRGTRILPGKENLLIPDFLWHSERHSLCRPGHLMAESEDVADKLNEKMVSMAGGDPEPVDMEALKEAQAQVLEDREAALAKKLAEQRRKKARLVDPLQFAMSIGSESMTDHNDALPAQAVKPTLEQLRDIEARGLSTEGMTAGMASEVLDMLCKRERANMASPKQIRFLEGYGFKHAGKFTRGEAGKLIGRVQGNAFRLPDDMAEQIRRGA